MPLDQYGYPDDESLDTIANMDTPTEEVFRLVIENWNYGVEWGYKSRDPQEPIEEDKEILRLATGGWSGNESVISALHHNFLMGSLWVLSARGGLHIYEIPKDMAEKLKY